LNTMDYDKALYYTHRSEWDHLLILMVRTQDDLLSKKIEHFLHAYNFEYDYSVIQRRLTSLLRYIDHALEMSEREYDIGDEPYIHYSP
jgi:YhdB-like protein